MQLNELNIPRDEIFQAAILGYEVQRQRVIEKIGAVREWLSENGNGAGEGFTVAEPPAPSPWFHKQPRTRSAAVRRRMSLAQKRSWARRRREAAR